MSLTLFAVTFLVFARALSNQFVDWDDDTMLLNNPNFRGLSWTPIRWMFTTMQNGHYQPLSWLTLGLDYLIWDLNPAGYHLTSIFLHCLNTALFYCLCQRLLALARPPVVARELTIAAAFAALLFAIHPLRVESVVWATERRDVLSAFFFLAAIYSYLQSQRPNQSPNHGWVGLVFMCQLLSLLAKATAITLPLVLIILDFYPLRRSVAEPDKPLGHRLKRLLLHKLPFFCLSLVFGIVALIAQREFGALQPLQQYGTSSRVGQALYGMVFYLWKTVLPLSLSPLYELPYETEAWIPAFIVCGILVGAITIAAITFRRRWPALLAGWLYYVVVVAPVLGIAQSGPQLVADRYSYLSCLPWPLLLAGVILLRCTDQDTRGRLANHIKWLSATAIIVLVIFGAMTLRQIAVWRDTPTLWNRVIAAGPPSSIAHFNLGRFHEEKGDHQTAKQLYQRSVAVNPSFADAHHNLARLLVLEKNEAAALTHYFEALRFKPNDAETHNNLGLLLLKRGQVKEAFAEFERAVKIDPRYFKGFYNLGRAWAQQGSLDKAHENLSVAIALAPDVAEAHYALAEIFMRQGRLDQATSQMREAIRLKPRSADTHSALARLLADQGDKAGAERHYREALRLLEQSRTASQFGADSTKGAAR